MYALHLNVYVTDDCNRKCSYCYNPKEETNKDNMTIDTALKVADWIGNCCYNENVQNFRCHFLGGEPFLNLPAVFGLIDTVESKYQIKGAEEGKYVIFTNGDFLDTAILKEMKRRKIYIYLHCMNELSLAELENRILFVKYICGGCSLSIVINDSPIDKFIDIVELAIKHKCHIRMNALYEVSPEYAEEYTKIYKDKVSIALDLLIQSGWAIYPNFLQSELFITWDKIGINPHFCGKCFYVINTAGELRSCTMKNTYMGTINDNYKDLVFHQRHTAKNLSECKSCEWVTWCQGGCPARRKIATGSVDNKIYLCEAYKELFPKMFVLRDRWLEYKGGRTNVPI